MPEAFICDGIRTPIGRYAGGLAKVRTDDLGAVPLRALMKRNPNVDWSALDEVVFGCANQAGEDNRNVARMSALLAGQPMEVPGATINRLCGSGLGRERRRIEREAQDRMALASQQEAVAAQRAGHLAREITPVISRRRRARLPSSPRMSIHARPASRRRQAQGRGAARRHGHRR
jgi:acetyl-CoA acetyltransferase